MSRDEMAFKIMLVLLGDWEIKLAASDDADARGVTEATSLAELSYEFADAMIEAGAPKRAFTEKIELQENVRTQL